MKTFVLCLLLVASALAAPSGKPRFKRGLNKIVGGSDVAPGDIPYQVSFQDTSFGVNFHFCGGSVYSADWIICAAHCVAGEDFENPDNLQIVAGENDLDVDEDTEQAIALSRIIQHEYYNRDTFENDVSLLQLSSSLSFDDYVQPVALPEQEQDFTGRAVVSGWGTTTEGGSFPSILQSVTVPIVSDADCRAAYSESDIVDSMLCAGADGLDSCQGNSGGPMTCTSQGSTYLCGIVSWGYGCARPDYPGVYTEVSYFVDWIQTNSGVKM